VVGNVLNLAVVRLDISAGAMAWSCTLLNVENIVVNALACDEVKAES